MNTEHAKTRSGWCGISLRSDGQWWPAAEESHKRCISCACKCHEGTKVWEKPVPESDLRSSSRRIRRTMVQAEVVAD